ELAILLQASLPGAPCVFAGDEIGTLGGKDPDARKAFPWDESRWNHGLVTMTRDAFGLRHAEATLRADAGTTLAADGRALAIGRDGPSGRLAVVLNAGEGGTTLDLRGAGASPVAVLLAAGRARSDPAAIDATDGGLRATLPPRSGVVIRLG